MRAALLLIFVGLLGFAPERVDAQTVLACTADWGASQSCGGCSGLVWADPAGDPKVYSPDAAYWTKLSALASTARVAISTNTPGAATCQTSNLVTKASLSASPSTPPPPTTPPTSTTGTATIEWTYSTTRTDGSVFTPAGANVYAGISPTAVTKANSALIGYPTASYVVAGLVSGTWYFRVAIVDAAGVESAQSNPVSLVVNVTSPTCGAAPVDETQTVQCTAPAVGSWTQSRTFTSAAYPACWTPTAWSPATAPASACTTPVVTTWKVATNGTSATRPAYELILDAAGVNLIRGYQLGTVGVGKPCGDVKRIAGTTEYHDVAEADITLASPTYRGRALVAVCSKQ